MSEVIRVLCYTEKWTSGGIESFIMNIYRNLDLEKVNFDILTSQDESRIHDEEIQKLGGKKMVTLQKKYKSPIMRTLRNFSAFANIIKINQYEIIHLHICHGVAMIYAFIAKMCGVKTIILHSHNTNIGASKKSIKLLAHKVCKHLFEGAATDYFACSDLAAEWLYTKKTLKSGKVKIIHNAIDVEKYSFNQEIREKTREKLGFENNFVVGHIGRFGEQKNHSYLIKIFEKIYENCKEARLLLIGEGELKQEIEQEVEKSICKDAVLFYGVTKDVPACLWAMDIFLLPSLFEGNPVVGVEAQAAGLKCFFSDSITRQAKITDNVKFVSIEESPDYWANEILSYQERYERENLYTKIVDEGYDIKTVARQMQEFYLKKVENI